MSLWYERRARGECGSAAAAEALRWRATSTPTSPRCVDNAADLVRQRSVSNSAARSGGCAGRH